MKLNNPFVISGYKGPAYFCDRVAETERLCTIIRNDGNATVLAPRRYGKTGLIHNAFERLRGEGYETVYLDIFSTQNLADFTSELAHAVVGRLDTPVEKLAGAARRLLQRLRPKLALEDVPGKPSLSFAIPPEEATETLEDVFAYLSERTSRTVVAIDEFQQVGEYPEKGLEAKLRALISLSPVQFVFAGSKQHLISEMFNSPKRPFYQSTTMLPLGVIPEDRYFAFANRFFRNRRWKLSRETFHAIYSKFGGITGYVQAILWDFYARGGDATDPLEVDEMVLLRVLANEYESQRLLDVLPDGARRLLRAIAREDIVTQPQSGAFVSKYGFRAASSVKTALDLLERKELVYRERNGYVVYDRLLAEYLREVEKP